MFGVTKAQATAIRRVFEQEGDLSATVELRRDFSDIMDNALARACARTIAERTPLPMAARLSTRQ